MPYASGGAPLVGDYVKNRFEQLGTVVEVKFAPMSAGKDLVSVRWDDGGDSSLTPATEFTLIRRQG